MQPPDPPARPPFSWTKGLLHASAVLLLFLMLGILTSASISSRTLLFKIGEAMGRDVVWAFALTFVASYGFQTRRNTLGTVMLSLAGLLIAGECLLLVRAAIDSADHGPLTAQQTERPERDSRHPRLCQAALGFSFPDPGKAFVPAPALEAKLQTKDASASTHNWAWRGSGVGIIFVQAIKGVGVNETSFRDFAAGVKSELAKNGKLSAETQSLQWSGGRGELTFSALHENGVHVHIRCRSRNREGDRPPLAICLQTFTGEGDPLHEIRAGLDLTACGGG